MTDAGSTSSAKTSVPEEIEDPVELMLKKTGCTELHYKVQECIAETQDWRKCKDVVATFRQCMSSYMEEQQKKYTNLKK